MASSPTCPYESSIGFTGEHALLLASDAPPGASRLPAARAWRSNVCRPTVALFAAGCLVAALTFLDRPRTPVLVAQGEPRGSGAGLSIDQQVGDIVELARNPAWDSLACYIDVNWVILRIANSVTAIRSSMVKCKDTGKDPQKQALCSAAVNGAIHNLLFVIGITAKGVIDCGQADNQPAACIDNIIGVVANLDNIASQSSAVNSTCTNIWSAVPHPTTAKRTTPKRTTTTGNWTTTTRRQHKKLLWPTGTTLSPAELKKIQDGHWRSTDCWISTNHIPLYFIKAALTIAGSVTRCAPGTLDQYRCTVDMLSLMGTVLAIAKYVSRAIPNCVQLVLVGEPWVKQASCAADVTGITGSLCSVISGLMMSQKICGGRRLRGDLEALLESQELDNFDPSAITAEDAARDALDLRRYLEEHFSSEELQREGLLNESFLVW